MIFCKKNLYLLFMLTIAAVLFSCNTVYAALSPFEVIENNLQAISQESKSRLVSVDFKQVDVKDVLRALSLQQDVNIVYDSSLSGIISIHLTEIPFEKALKLILKTVSCDFVKEENIYKVFSTNKKAISEFAPYSLEINNEKISLEAKNVDIRVLLRSIAQKANLSIVFDKSVTGKISVNLIEIPIREALLFLAEDNGYFLDEIDGVFKISKEFKRKYLVSFKDNKLFIDSLGGKLSDILRDISLKTGTNIIICGNVSTIIRCTFKDFSIEDALKIILVGTEYQYRKLKNVYIIGTKQALKEHSVMFSSNEVIQLNHIDASYIVKRLPSNFILKNIKVLEEQNALVVSGTQEFVENLKAFIKKIDNPMFSRVNEIVKLNNVKAEYILKNLPFKFSKETEIRVLDGQNAILVSGVKKIVDKLKIYILQMDKLVTQIDLDILVVEYQEEMDNILGVELYKSMKNKNKKRKSKIKDYNFDLDFPYYSTIEFNSVFQTYLKTLIDERKINICSNPRVETLSGKNIEIDVIGINNKIKGGDFNKQRFNEFNRNIKLRVNAKVINDDEISIELEHDFIEKMQETLIKNKIKNSKTRSRREIKKQKDLLYENSKKAKTVLRVKNGSTLVMGGLLQTLNKRRGDSFGKQISLMDVLENKSKFNMGKGIVFYITPKIVKHGEKFKTLYNKDISKKEKDFSKVFFEKLSSKDTGRRKSKKHRKIKTDSQNVSGGLDTDFKVSVKQEQLKDIYLNEALPEDSKYDREYAHLEQEIQKLLKREEDFLSPFKKQTILPAK
jgi:type II secretory pathway component HofQ